MQIMTFRNEHGEQWIARYNSKDLFLCGHETDWEWLDYNKEKDKNFAFMMKVKKDGLKKAIESESGNGGFLFSNQVENGFIEAIKQLQKIDISKTL